MRFTQIEFILFFIFLLGCLFLVRENRARKIILLVASYYFYAYWDWRFLSLLMFVTFSDFQIGKLLSKSVLPQRRRLLIAVSVLINLGLLAVFKYFNFFLLRSSCVFYYSKKIFKYHPPILSLFLTLFYKFY